MDMNGMSGEPIPEGAGMDTQVSYPRPKPKPMPKFEITEDIVISGISGRFPESDNMDEYAHNLFSNIDMVTADDRRWPIAFNDGLGSRTGKLKQIDKFDSSYFSTLTLLADAMDPQARIMLETTYESIIDAGVCPQSLRGTKTGVYVGINTVACADGLPQDDYNDCRRKEAALWVYGSAKPLYANRISFLFDFHGPSTLIDTACSASMVALTNALQDIRTGNCDAAIVATGNLTQAPFSNGIYQSIGLLASDGKCKVWDKKADGFVRSETVGSIFLQKRSDAKRVYATVLHAKTNTDGFKSIGLFSPFWLRQRDLMIETYQEAGVDPNEIKFFESHGTGTNVGDPQEAKAIADAYCHERKEPLLLGAVKSNLGHSEGSSGLCSLAKVIVAFENKCIPANLHYEEPKPEIECVVNKTLIPVMKNTPFENGIVGVNSFGVGGVNAHALLKSNEREATDDTYNICDPIPRLVNVSGRNEAAVNYIFDFIENNPKKVHKDFLALLGESMKTQIIKGSSNFPYRGYMIVKEKSNENSSLKQYEYERTICDANRPNPVWLCFSGMGSQWTGMAKKLMPIKTFSDTLKQCAATLEQFGIDLWHLLLSDDDTALKKCPTNAFVAITSMQIALYDTFCLLGIEVVGIIGHSFGEVACAYADGCLTLEQTVLTAYWRGKIVETSKLPKGMLAAVGMTWDETKRRCPDGIVAACHNGSDSVTISGLYDNMAKFVEQLKTENIFAREVAGGDFPYHSPFMNIVAAPLIEALNKVIPNPKQRSERWVSTSFPREQWESETAKYASGEYFTNNMISPVLFNEGMREIGKNSYIIEVAPHSLFESIFKRCFPSLTYTGLMKRTESDNLTFFMSAIGRLFTLGLNPTIENFYPKVEWPVCRGTQSISSLMKWDHERCYEVKKFPEFHNYATASDFVMKFSLLEADWNFLKDHAVDGRVIFPATGYLMMAWRRLAAMRGQPWMKTPVHFENVRFYRPTLLSETTEVKFIIRVLEGTGDFTISENNAIACTGKVSIPEDPILEMQDQLDEEINEDKDDEKMHEILYNKDIYKELRIRGYDYGQKFQGLVEARGDGRRGKAKWTGHWVSFVDSVMHLALVALPIRTLFIPIGFQSIRCDPNVLFEAIEKVKKEKEEETEDNEEKPEFFYFRENNKAKGLDEINTEEDIKGTEIISEIRPDMDENETKEADYVVKQQIKAAMGNEDKISILPVSFDLNFRSIVTRGLEIKGFIPVNVPRRPGQQGLTLEKYDFIPHFEDMAIESPFKDNLIEYISVCCALAEKVSQITPKVSKPVLNGYKSANEALVKKYTEIPEDNWRLMKLLKELVDLKMDSNQNVIDENKKESVDLEVAIKEIIEKTENNLTTDLINTVNTSERFIRPFVDLVLENSTDKTQMKVLEMNASQSVFGHQLINKIKDSCIGLINVDYTIVNTCPSNIPEETKALNLKTLEWDLNTNQFIKDIQSLDLLVYQMTNKVVNSWKLEDQIHALSDTLKFNGFLFLMGRSKLTPPENTVYELLGQNSSHGILSVKELDRFIELAPKAGLKLVGKKSDSYTTNIAVFRKVMTDRRKPIVLNIPNGNYEDWVEPLKKIVVENKDSDDPKNIWLVANDSPYNGTIGLLNCLRQESGGVFVRCIFDYDQKLDKEVDFEKSPYNELFETDLVCNIFKNGKWGSLRHILLPEEQETIDSEHAYLNVVTRGDMSSLKWFDAHHKYFPNLAEKNKKEQEVLCNVYYSALNFKDVVLVSGKIQPGPEGALFDCIIGLEFAGRRSDNGKKVMGMVPFKGIATTLLTYKDYLWDVPDDWTLEDAATVPVVYTTAYYALIMRGSLQEGESVLIHSGAGGVGQAAIFICQSMGCEVYVTVGNEEKRQFIKSKFGIDDDHIGNSHDVSFERQFMTISKGKGVDVVLNSLTEDKLQASLRCLAPNGRFLEIGKYDMQMNKNLGLFAFLNNISFHGVGLDCIFREGPSSKKLQSFMKEITRLLNDGIARGVVKPIEKTVFNVKQSEQAFRYMTTGKHVGKVLIKIRDEEREQIVITPKPLVVKATTRTWFHPIKTYIIIGGLGGFGLELAYWTVLRGAKKLILTSRTGIKNAYQQLYLKRFKEFGKLIEDYKIDITISTHNLTTLEGTNALIDEANTKGPVGGVFNLALVLKDAMLENQTAETFRECCEPKLEGLLNLDVVTQKKCPELDYFVAFSSLTSGRGNAGQTNYGYANSGMERICEIRRAKGLPGLSIQWGPIGDVGIVAEQLLASDEKADMMKLFAGILLQRISSCFDVLDRFMQCPNAVMASTVKADLEHQSGTSEDEVLHQLCNHLGIDKRPNDETLGDVGLDSMAAVEIQQRLERDYDISLALSDIKKITVGELKEFRDGKKDSLKQYAADIKKARANLSQIKFDIPNEQTTLINEVKTGKPIFFLPPIEGIFESLRALAKELDRPVVALNWMKAMQEIKDIKKVAIYYKEKLKQLAPEGDYDLVGHSFGAVIGIQMCRKKVPIRALVLLDPFDPTGLQNQDWNIDERFEMVFTYLKAYIPERIINQIQKDVMEIKGEQARITKLIELMKHYGGKHLHGKDVEDIIRGSFERADMVIKYKKKNIEKMKSISQTHSSKVVKKKLKQVTTDVSLIKLLKKEEDFQVLQETALNSYGFRREDFVGRFDVYTVLGSEADFLTTHLEKVTETITSKLNKK
ncbi:fatty acid synthase-like [Oppia nitens]|uniref:fatty acid synthase-like n=1 Tax=Oppia nitens TaxID=1686743 RepID=UPI0023DAD8C1|nr:fatty acid synthase-like [Oppia nitens]